MRALLQVVTKIPVPGGGTLYLYIWLGSESGSAGGASTGRWASILDQLHIIKLLCYAAELAYFGLRQDERAINFHQQHLTIAWEIGDRQGEDITFMNMGNAQLKLEDYSESPAKSQATPGIFQEIGDKANGAKALKELADLHKALGEIEVARQYDQQALALATDLGIPLQAECEILLHPIEAEATPDVELQREDEI